MWKPLPRVQNPNKRCCNKTLIFSTPAVLRDICALKVCAWMDVFLLAVTNQHLLFILLDLSSAQSSENCEKAVPPWLCIYVVSVRWSTTHIESFLCLEEAAECIASINSWLVVLQGNLAAWKTACLVSGHECRTLFWFCHCVLLYTRTL